MNIYDSPEKFGLTIVGDIQWSRDYDFDIHVLFFNAPADQYSWAHDSGCSCPTPFEGQGIPDLMVLSPGMAGVLEFQAELEAHNKDRYRHGAWESLPGEVVDLLARYAERVR